MKRKPRGLLILCFALIAVFSVVGFGFSAWSFTTEQRQDLTVGVQIADSATAGEWLDSQKLPSFVVLDEGVNGGISSTITGISFYRQDTSAITGKVETLIDTDFTIVFQTRLLGDGIPENEDLKFGMRVGVTGKLDEFVRHTSAYTKLKKAEGAPSEDYIDLKAFCKQENFDGTNNFSWEKGASGYWEYHFKLTTTIFGTFFTYVNGKRPSTKELYDELKRATQETGSNFFIELWQGGYTGGAS